MNAIKNVEMQTIQRSDSIFKFYNVMKPIHCLGLLCVWRKDESILCDTNCVRMALQFRSISQRQIHEALLKNSNTSHVTRYFHDYDSYVVTWKMCSVQAHKTLMIQDSISKFYVLLIVPSPYNHVKKTQLDAQFILSIFCQPLHVLGISRSIIRWHNPMFSE